MERTKIGPFDVIVTDVLPPGTAALVHFPQMLNVRPGESVTDAWMRGARESAEAGQLAIFLNVGDKPEAPRSP